MKKTALLTFGLLLLSSSYPGTSIQAASYIPVVSGQFYTGQWYFDGARSSMGGNGAITYVPAIRFSPKFTLLPSIESDYRGTRSAEELAGGSTLFQDTWENAIGVKAVHGLNSKWSVKERVGYRSKWFRETVDERWQNGLYDYKTVSVGAEVERRWGKVASLSLGYDFSSLAFPNYETLESSQNGDMSREYSGANALDQRVHLFSLQSNTALPWNSAVGLQAFYSPRDYTDQTVVNITGLLTPEKRKDVMFGGMLSLDHSFAMPKQTELISTLIYSYAKMDSSQNHYDARQTTFIPDFYDYNQNSLGTRFTYYFGKGSSGPMMLDAGYSYTRRNYTQSLIQSKDGAYLNEKLITNESIATFGFAYPLSKNFRMRILSTFGKSSSNNHYEQLYRYNFSNSNYLFGVTYDY